MTTAPSSLDFNKNYPRFREVNRFTADSKELIGLFLVATGGLNEAVKTNLTAPLIPHHIFITP